MKRILSLSLALIFALSLFACASQPIDGNPEDPFAYDYDLSPYVTLPAYYQMKIDKASVTPTEKDLETQRQNDFAGKVTDRAAKDGDTVVIDYVGKKDGVAFEGGTATNQSITIGKGGYIDGFEDGLIGVKPGETVDVDMTFPDPYPNNPDLAGVDVVFTMTVHYIKTDSTEVPKLTDELVKTFTDYKTVEEYEAGILAELSQTMLENVVWNKLMSESQFPRIPEIPYNRYRDDYINNYKTMADTYNMDFSSFLAQMGTTEAQFLATAKEYADNSVKADLIIYGIAKEKNLTPTEADRKAELDRLFEEYAPQYNFPDVDAMIDYLGEENTDKLVMHGFINTYVCKNAVISE